MRCFLKFSGAREPSQTKGCRIACTEHQHTPHGIPTSRGTGHPVASVPSSAQPPRWAKAAPLPAGGVQGDSLELGLRRSGLQPACNGPQPRDDIGQRVPGGGHSPGSTEPLHNTAEPAAPLPQALESKRSSRLLRAALAIASVSRKYK